nr:uncharacterized protein LOC112012837 [Quercus suber]
MAIIVDLEKVYDKLEWSFIREVLINANLPFNLVNLIMSCMLSVSTSILFNGGRVEAIFPSRGIRQDNLVLFVKADHVSCSTIRDVLDSFCARSGQSISESKSRVYFSPNADVDIRESLRDILGFHSTPNLGKYLGFPIKHRGASNQDLNFILERVKQKLARWKANLLSLAGRTVLIQASTFTAYIMQCMDLPTKLLDNIDRVNCNFLWGSSEASKRTHWVGWDKVTKPKEKGGLGIQSVKGRNQALLAKLNWRFRMEKDALWAKVLKSCKWAIERPHPRPPLEGEECLKVKDVFGSNGWDWSKLSIQIPNVVLMEIKAMPYSLRSTNEEDRMIWNRANRGDFELKSTYTLATKCSKEEEEFKGSWVANFPVAQVRIGHCYREANVFADFLARKGALQWSQRTDILRNSNTLLSEDPHEETRKDQLCPGSSFSLVQDGVINV